MKKSYRHTIKRERMEYIHAVLASGLSKQCAHWFANHYADAYLYGVRRKSQKNKKIKYFTHVTKKDLRSFNLMG